MGLLNGSMIKTIFFDIGGVLINIHPERTIQYLSDCTDVQPKIIRDRFPIDAHNEYEKGNLNDNEWFLAVKEKLPQPSCLKESDFYTGWRKLLGKEKSTVKLIERLNGSHSIWLLSNTNTQHIRDEIENRYLFPQLVDGAIYSFDAGYRKPDKEIYQYALRMAKTQPDQSLFIDDLEENILSAKAIGMHGIHFESTQKLEYDLIQIGLLK